jgi:predicted dienelactone hydrolase
MRRRQARGARSAAGGRWGRLARPIILLVLILSRPLAANAEEAPFHVGFLTLVANLDERVPVSVWYPTHDEEAPLNLGAYVLPVARDAAVAEGRHGLILLSHRSGGGPLDHRQLAAELASHGFIVVAPTHVGDALGRTEAHGTDVVYVGRAWQAVGALDAAIADPRLAGAIDADRIGMMGFDTGGYTVLLVAGGEPDFTRWPLYCDDHMNDTELCGGSQFPAIRITRPGWKPPHDLRIKAVVAMAPLGLPFGRGSLDRVTVPVRLYEAENDAVLLHDPNAAAILAALPRPPEHVVLPGGHFVFLDPCPPTLATQVMGWCKDVAGIDRAAIHAKLDAEIRDFFERAM